MPRKSSRYASPSYEASEDVKGARSFVSIVARHGVAQPNHKVACTLMSAE